MADKYKIVSFASINIMKGFFQLLCVISVFVLLIISFGGHDLLKESVNVTRRRTSSRRITCLSFNSSRFCDRNELHSFFSGTDNTADICVSFDVTRLCQRICESDMTVCFTPSQTVLFYESATSSISPFRQSFSPYIRRIKVSELRKEQFPQKWCRRRSKCLVTDFDPSMATLRRQKRCAIVGNSGILLKSKCGQQIDSHDFVMRANLAELRGYSDDVGTKSDLMMINTATMKSMHNILKGKKGDAEKLDVLLDYLRLLNGSLIWYPKGTNNNGYDRMLADIAQKLNRSRIKSKLAFSMPGTGYAASDMVGSKKYASSGLTVYYVAKAFCDDVTMYGFYPYDKDPSGQPVLHHYYEPNLINFTTTMHDFDKEHQFFKSLHEEGQLNLVTGACDSHS